MKKNTNKPPIGPTPSEEPTQDFQLITRAAILVGIFIGAGLFALWYANKKK